MLPLRVVEKDIEDFDEPVVELWREHDFVGHVFWDEDIAVVRFYPDREGDPFDLGLDDVQRVLDIANQIVMPGLLGEDVDSAVLPQHFADAPDTPVGSKDENRCIVELRREFEGLATYRNLDSEGFFPCDIAKALISRCGDLGLAVIEMEGLDWDGTTLTPRPDLHLRIDVRPGSSFDDVRSQANTAVATHLGMWSSRTMLVVSFVVQLPDGSTRVL